MSKQHLSAVDIDIKLGNLLIHAEEMSASISDDGQATFTGGVPDGEVEGKVDCTGSITVDTENRNLIIEAARNAGSFKALPAFDIITAGNNTNQQETIELFGCKLKISDLLGLNGSGGEKLKTKIEFQVTDPRFVRINGVPYLPASRTRNFIAASTTTN